MWQLRNGLLSETEFPYRHFVTTRSFGNMRDPAARRSSAVLHGIDESALVTAEQVHGTNIAVVTAADRGTRIAKTDGLITAERGTGIAIFTADCLPVFFGSAKAVGVIHAGWRGLAAGILPKAVAIFREAFSIASSDLTAVVGPHIQNCCFAVGQEVRDAFGISGDQPTVNLGAIAARQLAGTGVGKIIGSSHCTMHERELFFSYRADRTDCRLMSFIAR